MPSVPEYARELTSIEVNYLANIRTEKNYNVTFLREDKKILLRNSDSKGNLLDLTLPLPQLPEKPWVMCSLRTFNVDDCDVDVPLCENCKENPIIPVTYFILSPHNYDSLICCHHTIISS